MKAQSRSLPQPLVAFNSHELTDHEVKSELFRESFYPQDSISSLDQKDPNPHHRGWAISLFRSVAQSAFLSSGVSHFNGSSLSIPPTLKASQTP